MRALKTVDILDISNCNVNNKEREYLLDVFKNVLKKVLSSLISMAEVNTADFFEKRPETYLIKFERLLKQPRSEQWKASFYKDGVLKLTVIGQI